MKISQLFIYPIKSLRGCSVTSATLTAQGLAYDRKYMLVRVNTAPDDGDSSAVHSYESLLIGRVDALCLFTTALEPNHAAPEYFRVTYNHPDGATTSTTAPVEEGTDVPLSVDVPVAADYSGLQQLDIDLHGSGCVGYDMGLEYEAFFTRWLGFPTKLVYVGDSTREVLGNVAPGKAHVTQESAAAVAAGARSSYATSGITAVSGLVGGIWSWATGSASSSPSAGGKTDEEEEYRIHFSDCAPLLVTSEVSLGELNNGKKAVPLDITKARPNVVVTPSHDGEMAAFEEDFWSELVIRDGSADTDGEGTRVLLTANCGRCKSLNVDYGTGKQVPVADQMLKRLADMKRRVDAGHGYAPIFGRYGFVEHGSVGRSVSVGDTVDVSRRNDERTVFFWPSPPPKEKNKMPN